MGRPIQVSLCLSLALSACGGDPNQSPLDATDTSGETAADTGDGDGDPTPLASLSGFILAADGSPLPQAGGQFCGPINELGENEGSCASIAVAADGSWAHAIQPGQNIGDYNLKAVHGNTDAQTFSATASLLTIIEGDETEFEQFFIVPEVSNAVTLAGDFVAQVDMGTGLTVTIDPNIVELPLGLSWDVDAGGVSVGGVPISSEHWRFDEHNGETVLAMWAMSPFGAHAIEGESIDFVIEDSLGLDPGATVNFYEVDKDNAWIVEASSGTVSEDGSSIAPDSGLHKLSTLIVTAAN